jgi:hypothetical protein
MMVRSASVVPAKPAAALGARRLEALRHGRLPTPSELLATDDKPCAGSASHARVPYVHDVAARHPGGDPQRGRRGLSFVELRQRRENDSVGWGVAGPGHLSAQHQELMA